MPCEPPADARVQEIIDKLAPFAARNGPEFIEHVRYKQAGNTDYAFLDSGDPSHAYWSERLQAERKQLEATDARAEHSRLNNVESLEGKEVPAGLIPVVCGENLKRFPPYSPVDAAAVQEARATQVPPVMDEYLTLRIKHFFDTLDDYRPGLLYSDVVGEVSFGTPTGNEATEQVQPVQNDGTFRGNSAGAGAIGLGYNNSMEGKLSVYRNMKKHSSGRGKR
jgi:hypothetical protein